MDLKPTGNIARALTYALLDLLLLGYEVLVVVHLIQAGDWRNLGFPFLVYLVPLGGILVILAIFVTVFLGVYAFALLVREQGMRSAANGDEQQVPPAAYQPDRALALRDGERLVLTRSQSGAQALRRLGSRILTVLMLTALGEAIVVPLLPALRSLVFSLVGLGILVPAVATPPAPLDWVAAAFPMLMVVLGIASLPSGIASLRRRLIADDRGITSERFLGRSRFIPWNDIRIFARFTDNRSDAPDGAYMAWGRTHGLLLTIYRPSTPARLEGSKRKPSDPYRFDGGLETYTADARRLLATVAARSYQPLRTFRRTGAMLSALQRRFPLVALDLEDAQALPDAGSPWQPSADAIAAAPHLSEPLKLQVRLPFFPVLVESVIYFIVFAALVFAYIWFSPTAHAELLQPAVYSYTSVLAGDPVAIALYVIVAVMGIFAGIISVLLAIARRQGRRPGVVATEAGLRGRALGIQSSRQTSITMSWQEMRAWVVLPPTPSTTGPTRYLVFSDSNRMTWTEPAQAQLGGRRVRGDRRTAYHERAAALHALIAARSGLPLRVYAPARQPSQLSGTSDPA